MADRTADRTADIAADAALEEDRTWLEAFRRGERRALHDVFVRYSDSVARYLTGGFNIDSGDGPIRYTGVSRHDLHDFVAETFRRAFEESSRLGFSGTASYEGYLKRIARNAVIDQLRKSKPREQPQPESVASPERSLHTEELKRLLEHFETKLKPDYRLLFELRYRKQLGQEECGKQTGRGRTWVRRNEIKLRRELLHFLKDSGYLPAGASDE